MPRTDYASVDEILDTNLTQSEVEEWIDIASVVVDRIDDSGNADASTLERIEQLWSAHLVHTQDRRKQTLTQESATVKYVGGDEYENYGEVAMLLDPTNTLVGGGKPQANVHVLDGRGADYG